VDNPGGRGLACDYFCCTHSSLQEGNFRKKRHIKPLFTLERGISNLLCSLRKGLVDNSGDYLSKKVRYSSIK